MVYQPLRTINAEEMKRIIKLNERVQSQYEAQSGDDSTPSIQPAALSEVFPPANEGEELNVADVLVTCNFLFRDA
jgi:ATP-dependent DNA helicase 2 subunit 1